MKNLDRATITAISALAYSLANVVHEGLGHGGACILLGARPTMFNAIFFNYDETTASDSVQRAISAAGSILNVIVGLPLIALLRSRVPLSPRWRYFLWLFCAVNLLTAFGYLLFVSGLRHVTVGRQRAAILWDPRTRTAVAFAPETESAKAEPVRTLISQSTAANCICMPSRAMKFPLQK